MESKYVTVKIPKSNSVLSGHVFRGVVDEDMGETIRIGNMVFDKKYVMQNDDKPPTETEIIVANKLDSLYDTKDPTQSDIIDLIRMLKTEYSNN